MCHTNETDVSNKSNTSRIKSALQSILTDESLYEETCLEMRDIEYIKRCMFVLRTREFLKAAGVQGLRPHLLPETVDRLTNLQGSVAQWNYHSELGQMLSNAPTASVQHEVCDADSDSVDSLAASNSAACINAIPCEMMRQYTYTKNNGMNDSARDCARGIETNIWLRQPSQNTPN